MFLDKKFYSVHLKEIFLSARSLLLQVYCSMHINKYTFRLREIHHSIISYDTNLGKIFEYT